MDMGKGIRRALKLSLALMAVLAAWLAWAMASAQVEMSESGAHRRLLVPLGANRSIALPIYSGTGDGGAIRGFLEGPVVRRAPDGRWRARWFCEDRAVSRTGTGEQLSITCAGRRMRFDLRQPRDVPASAPMPARVAVLSDLEGNAGFLDAALPALGITDARGEWIYGDGHLIILGDAVDRGRDVFAVLWRLHDLSLQAQRAGGQVHFVLGNHEQYMLRTNGSRAHPEHLYALRQMGESTDAFDDDTVIGAWLRRQPVVSRLGTVLFAHGGISPQAASVSADPEYFNATMRAYWAAASASAHPHASALDAVLGPEGLTQFRGYLMAVDGRYPRIGRSDMDAILDRYRAERIVVGHTLVDRISFLHEGRIIAVDVNQPGARSQVLLFEDGQPRVIELAVSRHLEARPVVRLRDFEPSQAADRALLAAMLREMRRLSNLPHPY